MERETYTILGILLIILSLILFYIGGIPTLMTTTNIFDISVWLPILGYVFLLGEGIIVLMVGFGKYEETKFTKYSIHIMMYALTLPMIISVIVYMLVLIWGWKTIYLAITMPFLYAGCILAAVSFLLAFYPIIKTTDSFLK